MTKKTKKILCLILIASLVTFCLSSCDSSGTELSELMIIQGIGIDTLDDEFKVTVEILNNEQSGSPGGGSSEYKTKVYTSVGATVGQALRNLIQKSGNAPLFAHNRVIVLGEGAANKKISDVLDFFIRNYDSRASQNICVAKNMRGEDIIRAELLGDNVKSEILEKLLNKSYENSLVPKARIIDVVNSIKSETSVTVIPAVSVEENQGKMDYKLEGCAVFGKDETFSGYISQGDSEGLAFLRGKINKGYIWCKFKNGQKGSFLINKGKTNFKITEEQGRIVYNLNVELSCDLEEVQGAGYFSTDYDFMEKMKTSLEESVFLKMENTFKVLQERNLGDSLGFGRRLEIRDFRLYEKHKNNWEKEFQNAKLRIGVKVTIRRIGEETFHNKRM